MSYFRYVLVFVLGLLIGAGILYYQHQDHRYNASAEQLLSRFLIYADKTIAGENNRCEGAPIATVGEAVASIVGPAIGNSADRLTAGCVNQVCSLSRSDCKPWQSGECNQRFLIADENPQGELIPASFSCLDMP